MIKQIGDACTGCFACMSACPKRCISSECREFGHAYPVVDEMTCIECGECLRVCHAYGARPFALFSGKAFAAQANDNEILSTSSSGGVFAVIAREFIERGGVVYGVAWEKGSAAKHRRVDTVEGLECLRRSKYVQSDTRGIYEAIESDLVRGSSVLFSGVPCQVAALYEYLGRHPDNLVTIDLICHGVPSARLFGEYLSWLEGDTGSKIADYRSRDKAKAGWSCLGSIRLMCADSNSSKSYYTIPADDPYTLLFNAGVDFRESCYTCRYANGDRVGDITLGDFWGVEPLDLPIDIKKGVSAVLANSERGLDTIDSLVNEMSLIEVRYSDIARKNSNLNAPSMCPEIRSQLNEEYNRGGFRAVVPAIRVALRRDIIKNKIKRMLPTGLITLIKKRR